MAWIELHDNLPDHPKVIDLAEALNLDKDAVVGKLIRLWVWALNSREDGFLRTKDESTIADIMRYRGKPKTLIKALVEVRFLDPADGGYMIHGWDDHVSRLMEMRERRRAQARSRKQKQRAKERDGHAVVTRDTDDVNMQCHAATVPKPYLDDDDDTYNSLSSVRAREDIHRLSTDCLAESYRSYVGKDPTPAEADALADFARFNPAELVGEAVHRAATHGCKSVVAYVGRELAQWSAAGVETIEQLEEWEAEWRDPFAAAK